MPISASSAKKKWPKRIAVGLAICCGMFILTGFVCLSTPLGFVAAMLILPDELHYQTLKLDDECIISIEAETFCDPVCSHHFSIEKNGNILHRGGLPYFLYDNDRPTYQLVTTPQKNVFAITMKHEPDVVMMLYKPSINFMWNHDRDSELADSILASLQSHHPKRKFKFSDW